ncbi:T-cell immunoreceptor with Ig and ITIM domains-like isoform X3 [Paramormyrops kingsleyae]|uniref:T-cell immunoreceptor with Ig and ITIM domains-like isoform X3 n=1 Tax=Paramormyrops kingsleyae TaxID=1676925 RepID=UPI003B975B35
MRTGGLVSVATRGHAASPADHVGSGNVPHIITDPHVNADLGGDFTLNCRLSVSNTNVIQVEWSWGSSEKPEEKIVVFKKGSEANYPSLKFSDRITFFSHSQHHVSIRISDVIMNDTGNYVCQYTTFPSGSFQATTTVTVTEPSHGASLWIVGTVMAALLFTVLLAAAVYVTLKHARKTTSARSRPDQTTNDQDKESRQHEGSPVQTRRRVWRSDLSQPSVKRPSSFRWTERGQGHNLRRDQEGLTTPD